MENFPLRVSALEAATVLLAAVVAEVVLDALVVALTAVEDEVCDALVVVLTAAEDEVCDERAALLTVLAALLCPEAKKSAGTVMLTPPAAHRPWA